MDCEAVKGSVNQIHKIKNAVRVNFTSTSTNNHLEQPKQREEIKDAVMEKLDGKGITPNFTMIAG